MTSLRSAKGKLLADSDFDLLAREMERQAAAILEARPMPDYKASPATAVEASKYEHLLQKARKVDLPFESRSNPHVCPSKESDELLYLFVGDDKIMAATL